MPPAVHESGALVGKLVARCLGDLPALAPGAAHVQAHQRDPCNDRLYRIGQYKPVFVHVPLAMHPGDGDDSFDLKLDRLLTAKRSLSRHMLTPPTGDGDDSRLFKETAAGVGLN